MQLVHTIPRYDRVFIRYQKMVFSCSPITRSRHRRPTQHYFTPTIYYLPVLSSEPSQMSFSFYVTRNLARMIRNTCNNQQWSVLARHYLVGNKHSRNSARKYLGIPTVCNDRFVLYHCINVITVFNYPSVTQILLSSLYDTLLSRRSYIFVG